MDWMLEKNYISSDLLGDESPNQVYSQNRAGPGNYIRSDRWNRDESLQLKLDEFE